MTVIWEKPQESRFEAQPDRPYILLNAAMTLDGKIATVSGNAKISSEEDLIRLHQLRADFDAVIVGIETILTDDPQLTVRHVEGRNPDRVILDSAARTPTDAKVFTAKAGRTIIAVTKSAPKSRVNALQRNGAVVIVVGSGDRVDLRLLINRLKDMGIGRALVEGGGNVNWGFLELGLVDEMRVTVAPVIVGGKDAVTLVEGKGFDKVRDSIKLDLQRIEQYGEDLLLTYRIAKTE